MQIWSNLQPGRKHRATAAVNILRVTAPCVPCILCAEVVDEEGVEAFHAVPDEAQQVLPHRVFGVSSSGQGTASAALLTPLKW